MTLGEFLQSAALIKSFCWLDLEEKFFQLSSASWCENLRFTRQRGDEDRCLLEKGRSLCSLTSFWGMNTDLWLCFPFHLLLFLVFVALELSSRQQDSESKRAELSQNLCWRVQKNPAWKTELVVLLIRTWDREFLLVDSMSLNVDPYWVLF